MMRHRDAGAIEEILEPTLNKKIATEAKSHTKKISEQSTKKEDNHGRGERAVSEQEVLIVASKLKQYIKDKAQLSTSAAVFSVLSDKIRLLCDEAIEKAKKDGRKTVMDRDFN